jgi:4-amino-4-deoxy-L-arabinose transferase-like glycosyltransferase
MLILSVLLYLGLSILASLRVFKRIVPGKIIILFFLITVTTNILIFQVLSLAHALDKPWWFFIGQVLLCLGAGNILYDPGRKIFKERLGSLRIAGDFPRGLDWFFMALIGAILALSLYIGSLVPINNSDSLHTHLPRIYYWIQHGSLESWSTITITQVNYPINMPLQGLWLFLFGGTERLFYLVPWFALLTAVVLVHQIARQLGFSYRASLFAALLSLSLPVVLLQTFSYQADVFVTTLVLATIFFLLEFLRGKRNLFLFLSTLPMAVALGTKQTAFLFLPFYLLVVLIHFIRGRVRFRRYLAFGGIFLLFFAVFSSYKFIQNYLERDALESSMFAGYRYGTVLSDPDAGRRSATNTLRYLYQGISVDGLTGKLKLSALEWRADAFRSLRARLGLNLEGEQYVSEGDEGTFAFDDAIALNEDAAWFGPLSVFLIPIASLLVLLERSKARKQYLLAALGFMALVFVMMSVLITGWSPTNGRYLVLPTLVILPLLAVLLPVKRVIGGIISVVLALAAAYLAFSSLLINDSNPLVTQFSLYSYQSEKLNRSEDAGFIPRAWTYVNDRVIEDLLLTSPNRRDILNQTYYQNLFYQSSEDISAIDFLEVYVPADEPLYLYIEKTIIEYALFGINKTRDLHPIEDPIQVPTGALLLADLNLLDSPPDGMSLIAQREQYMLLRKD